MSKKITRDAVIALRVTPAEFGHVRALAKQEGMSVSKLLYRWMLERLANEEAPELHADIDDNALPVPQADE